MPSQSITGKELLNGLLVQNSSIKKPITNKKPPSDLLFYKSFLYYKRTNITEHSKAFENYACSYMARLLFSRFNKST